MTVTVLRWADRRTEPWANGAGVTHPLARGAGDSWRVSIADLGANAQFSHLPDMHRQLVCLGPAPIVLYVDERPRELAVGDVTEFSGGSHVRCEVDQPSLVLNVMSRVETSAPSVQLLELGAGAIETLPRVKRQLVVVLAGTVQITTPEVTGMLARCDATDCHDTAVQLEGAGRIALVVP